MADQYRTLGYETLSITNTAGSLTAGVTGAKSFVGRLETAQVRFRNDGTVPTSSEGVLLEVGDQIVLSESDFDTSFIRTGGTSGTLKGHYFNIRASVFSGGN